MPSTQNWKDALVAGTSVGGARPKASVVDGDRQLIAKFSALADTYPVMKAEAVAMDLARCVGLDVAPSELIEVDGRDVLLVERFDRAPGGIRRQFVSALTILGLHELTGRHATYHDLADVIRSRFVHRSDTLRELFGRIVLNILTGNNDDHARNHAAFWDGERLALTPAYDICPQPRTGQEQAQAMAIATNGNGLAQVATCLHAAATYELTDAQAREIIDHQLTVIHDEWRAVADRPTDRPRTRRPLGTPGSQPLRHLRLSPMRPSSDVVVQSRHLADLLVRHNTAI
jgi:serine/threonine-protein kinase HipA